MKHTALTKIREKHPLVIRWTHWINFPLILIMTWSGLLIYWATNNYSVSIGGKDIFHFFPKRFYEWLNIPFRLSEGMAYHFLFMWFFALNGFLYTIYTLLSGEWRILVPRRGCLRDAWQVLLYDLHLKKQKPEQGKYNAAQQLAYTSIILMGLGSLLTGLAIYKPVQFPTLAWSFGGYHLARIIHFALTIGYVLFFSVHIIQVVLAGWNNFRAMVSGFEPVKEPEAAPITPQAELPAAVVECQDERETTELNHPDTEHNEKDQQNVAGRDQEHQ